MQQRQTLLTDLTEARSDLRATQDADQRALANSIRDSLPEPAHMLAPKVQDTVTGIEQRLAATELAVADLDAALIDAIEEHRAEWLTKADERLDGARATFGEQIENLDTAAARLDEATALRRFVAQYPNVKAGYSITSSPVPLRGLSGDDYRLQHLLDALRRLANAPPVRDPGLDHAGPGAKLWPTSGVSSY